jgi:4-amino-4-deoxy-L-arabinose transferase-like glycosyltransferase
MQLSTLKGSFPVRSAYLLTSIVLVALALRLVISPFINDLMSPQHIQCWEQGNVAAALASGHGFGSPFDAHQQPSAVMPPVYPLMVAAIFKVFGVRTTASVLAVHALDCALSALACIPVFLLARRSFGERVAWWAAWAWAFSPYGIYFAADWPWSTHLLLLCLCWLLYVAQNLEGSSRLSVWAGFGLLAGFAGLTEPSILVLVPFLLGLACWSRRRAGEPWRSPAFVAALALAATISPWMIRNALVFHRFIPMRDSMGLELWMGNNGYTERWTSDDIHPLHDMREQAAYDKGELAYMDRKAADAKAFIVAHPSWYAWMCLRRATFLWTGYWSFDRDYLALEPTDLPNIPFATALTLLCIAGLVCAWRRNRFEALRYGGVLFFFPIMYYFSHPEPYHLRPLDPIIVVLGCYAIIAWKERAKERAAVTAMPLPEEA